MTSRQQGLAQERASLRATLVDLGPDAPTTCGTWTSGEVAIHVAAGELPSVLLPDAFFRLLIAQGVRLDRLSGVVERTVDRQRRRGFDWALRQLDRPPPRLLSWGPISAVSLLEVWAHHEDVLNANADVGPCDSGIDLEPVLRVLLRYQRRTLLEHRLKVTSGGRVWFDSDTTALSVIDGGTRDLARWLGGRAGVDALAVTGEADLTGLNLGL